eukprot:1189722-Prorocentrum_minimum.AAC.6
MFRSVCFVIGHNPGNIPLGDPQGIKARDSYRVNAVLAFYEHLVDRAAFTHVMRALGKEEQRPRRKRRARDQRLASDTRLAAGHAGERNFVSQPPALSTCRARSVPRRISLMSVHRYPAPHRNPVVTRVPCPVSKSCRYQGTLPRIEILPLPGYPAPYRNAAVLARSCVAFP